MLKISLVLTVLLAVGVHGEKHDFFRSKNFENNFSLGKLRLANDGKAEELVPFKPEFSSAGQPLPSPCTGLRPMTVIAHPMEKTKFIECRDEFHYDIFTCPNAGEYNAQTGKCDAVLPVKNRCEEEKPCLNDGLCSIVSNSTFKCTCQPDWTGDRCETPMNSCVKKPCGPTGECRSLKTTDSEPDYICVCQGRKEYGYNCQDVVPNPCETGEEQFFPFAFSPRAYIQCDGELIYFQSCGSLLYWNQEEKYCDRKRPGKIDVKASVIKTLPNPKIDNSQQQMTNDESEELTTPGTTAATMIMPSIPESIRVFPQRPRVESEPTLSFGSNRINQRRPTAVELPSSVSNLPEQRVQDGPSSSFVIKSFDTSTRTPLPSSWRGQPAVKPFVSTFEADAVGQNDQVFVRSRAEPAFPTSTTVSQAVPETRLRISSVESSNEGVVPMRSWQSNPSRSDQFRVDNRFWFTTTATVPTIPETNGGQPFMRGEVLSSQQQQQRFSSNNQRMMETTAVGQNTDRLPASNEERFQPVSFNRFRGEGSFPTTSTPLPPVPQQQQSWFSQNNQRLMETTTAGQNIDRLPVTNEERFQPVSFNRFRGEGSFPTTSTPLSLVPQQQQSWFNQNNQRIAPAQSFQNGVFDTTTLASNIARMPGFLTANIQEEMMRETTTTPILPIRTWPVNSFTTPSWQQRQKQPLPMVDPSLLPSQSIRQPDQIRMENMEKLTTSTETVSFARPDQSRLSNANAFEPTATPNTESFSSYNSWRAIPTLNQRRPQDPNGHLPSASWKQRS